MVLLARETGWVGGGDETVEGVDFSSVLTTMGIGTECPGMKKKGRK